MDTQNTAQLKSRGFDS